MDKVDKALAWTGLIFGGGLSIAGNVRAAQLPHVPEYATDSLAAWRTMPEQDASGTALVAAVAVPFAAILLVEMLNRFRFLPDAVRVIALGAVAVIAAAVSWFHLFHVMLSIGTPLGVALFVPLIPDTIAIVSAMALLSNRTPDTVQPDTLDTVQPDTEPVQPVVQPDMSEPVRPVVLDTVQPDTTPDIVIPAPRRTRPDKAWMVIARDCILSGEPESDAEIAGKILADHPDTWNTSEAGRKAVSRLRKAMAESA